MAQDATYDTTVYLEREGNRAVAASGGTFAIESGGSMLVQDSGTLTLSTGAALSLISDAVVGLVGQNVAPTDMRHILASEFGDTVVLVPSALSVKLTGRNNLPKNARMVTIVGSTAMSKASFWLTSVSAGREVLLMAVGNVSGGFTNNNTSVQVSCSGCILLGSVGQAISGFCLYTSANSNTGVLLKAVADDTWAIVGQIGTISE